MYAQGIKENISSTTFEEAPNSMIIALEMSYSILLNVLLNDRGHNDHAHVDLQHLG
jgi:hypothetical protein